MKRLKVLPLKVLPLVVFALFLAGCASSKTKVLPPVQVTNTINVQPLWKRSVGDGTDKQYLALQPYLTSDGRLFVNDASGKVFALNADTGKTIWEVNTKTPLTSGPLVYDGRVIMGTATAEAIALDATNGKLLWRAPVSNEVLAVPGAGPGSVFVKTIDGQVYALDEKTGKQLWAYGLNMPTLILRAASSPVWSAPIVAVGFSNGKLAILSADSGDMVWQRTMASSSGLSAIQQMVDIDADPIISKGVVYVATYQGVIAAINLKSGQMLWQNQMSAYSGMAIDTHSLFVSDAAGHIWSFSRATGQVNWRQDRLQDRQITGPTLVGDAMVVLDDQGNMYWLDQATGKLLAKQQPDPKVPFYGKAVASGSVVYALDSKGKLYAYHLVQG